MAPKAFLRGKDRTPAYEAAVRTLMKLPYVLRERAFAEAHSSEARSTWVGSRGLKQAKSGQQWWGRLIGTRQPSVVTRDDLLPADDHFTLWLKDGQPEVYVSQPYDLSLDDMREIVAACDQHGLTVHATVRGSWHFPGQVMRLEYRRAKEDVSSG